MSHDTTLHRLIRPGVRLAAPSGVSPNQVTALRLLTALAASGAVATGRPVATAVGAGVFLLSMLLDRADGELARQTGRSSPGGHAFDLLTDCTADAVVLIGLGVGRGAELGWMGPALGLSAGVGVGVLFWLLNVVRRGPSATFRLAGGRLVVDADDALILLPVLLWLGLAAPTLWAAAVLTPAAALWLGVSTLRERRTAACGAQGRGEVAPAAPPIGAATAAAASSLRQR